MTDEKITERIEISCRASERKLWLSVFPRYELSRIARALLNDAAKKVVKSPGNSRVRK